MMNRLNADRKTKHISNQYGIVLVVALVFLIALTAAAAALMQNITTDMKMSGASEEKVVATQEAVSAIDEIIFNQVSPGTSNAFAASVVTFKDGPKDMSAAISTTNADGDFSSATLDVVNNDLNLEPDCPAAKVASSTQLFTCNVLKIQVNRVYGRNGTSTVNVNSGIAQQLLR
ncbi:MAG: hypothetical protein QF552_06075 [Litorilituus sp.]|jgi:hypothetical protein|nr:hypothetical protein [Litorilituus sp.]